MQYRAFVFQACGFFKCLLSLLCPAQGLLLNLLQTFLSALPAFNHKAYFGLKAADFGTGLVELTLGLVDLLAGLVMGLSDGFDCSLYLAEFGVFGFQRIGGQIGLLFEVGLLGLRLLAF